MLQCPKCGSQDIYYFHRYDKLNPLFIFPFVIIFLVFAIFFYVMNISLTLAIIFFIITFLLIFVYACVNFYYSKHPYLQVICKSCGHDWIPHWLRTKKAPPFRVALRKLLHEVLTFENFGDIIKSQQGQNLSTVSLCND